MNTRYVIVLYQEQGFWLVSVKDKKTDTTHHLTKSENLASLMVNVSVLLVHLNKTPQ